VAAILYTSLEANDSFIKRVKGSNLIQNVICVVTVFFIYIGCRYFTGYMNTYLEPYHCDNIPALIWGIVIVLMILGYPNFMTNFFGTNRFLTSYGKYSFGAYLWHIHVVAKLRESKFLEFLDVHNEFGLTFFVVLISYSSGYLFFCLVEDPMMKLANYLCVKIDRFFSGLNYTLISSN
jgi:peptidoglycan/LPS O-acetylase OafA/YrhL